MLRPLLRGESITPWRARSDQDWIIWTHDSEGAPLEELPPSSARWLGQWRHTLRARSDARGARWWSLFRTPAAANDLPRVVWADVGRTPRAVVLQAGDHTVPLNSCYVARAPSLADAHALAALLNSNVAAAWLAVLAEPARGGYRRYLGWTMALLPLPERWDRAREILAPLGELAESGDPPPATELDGAVMRAFCVRMADVAPLLAWTHR